LQRAYGKDTFDILERLSRQSLVRRWQHFNEETLVNTKRLKYIIIISLILMVIAITVFVIRFWHSNISDDIEHWAQFGDYLGGTLNPVLALINICIFIYLTLVVQDISNKNHEQALEMNQKVALMSMKRDELNHFKTEMDKVIADWEDDIKNIDKAKQMLYKYNVLEYRMSYLFPDMYSSDINKKFRQDIVESLEKMKEDPNTRTGPSVNVYGMLISELSKMVIE